VLASALYALCVGSVGDCALLPCSQLCMAARGVRLGVFAAASLRCRGVLLADPALRGGRLVAGDVAAVLLRLPAADELLLAAVSLAAALKPARLRLLLRRRTSQCMERLLRSELLPASVALSACMPPPAGLPPLPPLSGTVKGAGVMSALLEMGAVAATPLLLTAASVAWGALPSPATASSPEAAVNRDPAAGDLLPTWAAALSRPVAPPPALIAASLASLLLPAERLSSRSHQRKADTTTIGMAYMM